MDDSSFVEIRDGLESLSSDCWSSSFQTTFVQPTTGDDILQTSFTEFHEQVQRMFRSFRVEIVNDVRVRKFAENGDFVGERVEEEFLHTQKRNTMKKDTQKKKSSLHDIILNFLRSPTT